MRIRQLCLRPYRNFAHLDIELGVGGALIVADNGRGKSNILESISYLSIGKSIRGARDQEAVPHDGEFFDIRALWEDGSRQRRARVFYSGTDGKRVFLDDVPLPRVSELVSQFQTVHFAPEDVSLVLQFAAQRRRLLDIVISQARPDYLACLQRYTRVLTQRNHYLRNLGRRPADETERAAWDAQLAGPGAQLRRIRWETLVAMGPDFVRYYEGFCTGRERAGVIYCGQEPPAAAADIASAETLEKELRTELCQDPSREARAGHTLVGPHRDAFTFTLDGVEADTYASQGQLKSVLLSWKMAEARYLEALAGDQPVLLFDDVFSELDEQRSQQLMRLANDFEQVILTTPRPPGEEVSERFERIELPT